MAVALAADAPKAAASAGATGAATTIATTNADIRMIIRRKGGLPKAEGRNCYSLGYFVAFEKF